MKVPHNWIPEAHQAPVIINPARFKVLVWHRKAHKTTLDINELIRWAAAIPGTYWYVAPFREEAKKTVWDDVQMLAKYCPPEAWDRRNNSDLFIPFPNGSKLYVLGADRPDSLRGPNPKGVVLDEYDTMKPEMWSAVIQPIMMANPTSWCWFTGTYKGVRDLHGKYHFALDQMKEKGENSDWYGLLLKASQTGIISKEALEEAKKTTSESFYLQEYECEAIESAAAVFRGVEFCLYDGDITLAEDHRYHVGVDIAKFNDWTVMTPFDLMEFKSGMQDRFNKVDYPFQKAKMAAKYYQFNKAKMKVDGTGVGAPVVDDLRHDKIDVDSFIFTEQSRRDLLMNLQIKFEQRTIKIPRADLQLQAELKAFQYQLTEKGRTKMGVPEGMTDDCVMSLALAVWEIPDQPLTPRNKLLEERELVRNFDANKKRVMHR